MAKVMRQEAAGLRQGTNWGAARGNWQQEVSKRDEANMFEERGSSKARIVAIRDT